MCLAIPGQIMAIDSAEGVMRTGQVNFGGIVKTVNLAYTPDAELGDYVLVHVGFAISIINEAEAQEVFAYLDALGELDELHHDGDML